MKFLNSDIVIFEILNLISSNITTYSSQQKYWPLSIYFEAFQMSTLENKTIYIAIKSDLGKIISNLGVSTQDFGSFYAIIAIIDMIMIPILILYIIFLVNKYSKEVLNVIIQITDKVHRFLKYAFNTLIIKKILPQEIIIKVTVSQLM